VSLAAYGHALAVTAYAGLAYTLWRKASGGDSGPVQRALIVALLLSAAWASAGLVAYASGYAVAGIAAGLLDLARYGAWFHLLWVTLKVSGSLAIGRGAVLFVALWSTIALCAVVAATGGSEGAASSALTRSLPLLALALPVGGLVLTEQLLRGADPDARWHLKPLGLGMTAIFLYDLYLHSQVLLLGRFDADSLSIRSFAHALPVALFYIAAKRQSGWRGSFTLSRETVFHTATLMLVGVYLLLLSGIGFYVRNLGGDIGGALELALLFIGLIGLSVLLSSGALRAKLRVFLGKNFVRYRYDYRTEWLRFTSRLTAAATPQEVGVCVARALAEMLNSPAAALWYKNAEKTHFAQTARWNAARADQREAVDSPFSRYIGLNEWVVELDEAGRGGSRQPDFDIPAWLNADPQYWLVVPLIVVDELSGFVVIERPHASIEIDWEVRDLLKTAGRQAASYLALMHTTNALLEARKFEAFNKMSAFVVHDLKNIVAQLSLMMQNARRLRDNAEFQQDMLATVDNSLDKMRRLMLQLRNGETQSDAVAGVALGKVLERIAASARARGREIEVQLGKSLVSRGHEDRVERVLGHIVDNALDATEQSGTVAASIEREGSQAKVTIRDTGQGMSREFVATRLFKPFNSTKANGMGIGSYESQQYIREIGGHLAVDSELGQGTVVTVLLPLLEVGMSCNSELYASAK
jgi:putative PEP-CTERM system histidine kinase